MAEAAYFDRKARRVRRAARDSEIRNAAAAGVAHGDLATEYGVTGATIRLIVRPPGTSYYAKHRDERLAYERARRAANPDAVKAQKAAYYARNKSAYAARGAAYYAKNRDRVKARTATRKLARSASKRAKKAIPLAQASQRLISEVAALACGPRRRGLGARWVVTRKATAKPKQETQELGSGVRCTCPGWTNSSGGVAGTRYDGTPPPSDPTRSLSLFQ